MPRTVQPRTYPRAARTAETLAREYLTAKARAIDVARAYVEGEASLAELITAKADFKAAEVQFQALRRGS